MYYYTNASFVISYNLIMDELGTNEIVELTPLPLPINSNKPAEIEQGTRRYGFSFYYHQPVVSSHSSLDPTRSPVPYYYYAFRTIYSPDVNVNNYVDWVQVGSESHNIGNSEQWTADDGSQMTTLLVKASDKSADD